MPELTPEKEMQWKTHNANEPTLHTEGGTASTAERKPSGYDRFSISDQMKKDMDIPDGWECKWIRDDGYWQSKVPGNRFYEFEMENPGAKMCIRNGQPFRNGMDLVLAMIPPETAEAHRKEDEAAEKAFYKKWDKDAQDDDFDKSDVKRLRQIKARNSAMHAASGMIGQHSRTQGLGLEEAEELEMRRGVNIEEEELRWSLGRNRSARDISEEQAEALAQQRSGRNTTYSLPATVAPKNLAKT